MGCAELEIYLHYCRGLSFTEQPDYDHLRGLFHQALSRTGSRVDADYDWKRLPEYRKGPAGLEKACRNLKPQSGSKEGKDTPMRSSPDRRAQA